MINTEKCTSTRPIFKCSDQNFMEKIPLPDLQIRMCNWKSIFLTYVMGTQKNHLNEMVLLSTQNNMLKLIDK